MNRLPFSVVGGFVNPCTWARLPMSLFIAKQLYMAPALYFVNHNVIILDILWLMLY